jgi:hypothetical protein
MSEKRRRFMGGGPWWMTLNTLSLVACAVTEGVMTPCLGTCEWWDVDGVRKERYVTL